jgi:hypothetical protein
MSLEFHGKMLVRTFKQSVLDTFGIRLKVHKGFSMGQTADDGATIASIRSEGAGQVDGSLSLAGSMSVAEAESQIRNALGFAVQVLDVAGANADNASKLSDVGFRMPAPVAQSAARAPAASAASGDISVTGQKKLATIQSEFSGKFPQLGLMFFSLEEAKKADQGHSIKPLPSDQTVASVRTKSAKGDLSIHGNTTVGTLESAFRDDYGLFVQVCYMREGKPVYTGASLDAASLSELNRRAAEQGRGAFAYPSN